MTHLHPDYLVYVDDDHDEQAAAQAEAEALADRLADFDPSFTWPSVNAGSGRPRRTAIPTHINGADNSVALVADPSCAQVTAASGGVRHPSSATPRGRRPLARVLGTESAEVTS